MKKTNCFLWEWKIPELQRLLRVMKLTTFLFLISVISVFAGKTYSQTKALNLKMSNSTVKEVLRNIEDQSEFYFMYSEKLVDVTRHVSINIEKAKVDEVLDKLFASTDVKYKVTDRFILLITPEVTGSDLTVQQQKSVSGKVTDTHGSPLPGVTVVVKGTTTGIITDNNGSYSLTKVPENATLQFSFVGMKTQEVPVNNKNTINIILEDENVSIDEVVAIGYGTQKKKDITSAISSISSKDLVLQSATNVQNLFQGRLSGVSVKTSGVPGEAPSIRVRGIGTIGNNNPLYVIDGFPTKSELASNISPSDIESVQVLKDASSASIYGAQASNGVILITTKQGKSGKTGFDVKINTGVQLPSNLPQLLNSTQYGEVLWNAMKNAGLKPSHAQYGNGAMPVVPDFVLPSGAMEGQVDLSKYNTLENQFMRANKVGTNWANEVSRPAQTSDIGISAQGGSQDSKYFFSSNYSSQDAIVKWSGYDRLSLRGNSQFSVSKNVTFGESMSVAYSKYKGSNGGVGVRTAPLIPVYDVMNNWAGSKANGLGDNGNAVASLYNQRNNYNETLRFMGNLFMDINFLKSFHFKTTVGTNYESGSGKSFNPITYWEKGNTLVNALTVGRSNTLNWVWNNTLNYSTTFANNHSINILLGSEAQDSKSGYLTAYRTTFAVQDPDFWYLSAGEASKDNSEIGSQYSLFSLFSRVNYQYKEKLYLSAIVRRDGSSRFGKSYRYGYFPGVSGAWRISDEPFMSSQSIISDLKLRASYGQTGNQDIGNYPFASTYGTNIGASSYPIKGNPNSVTQGISKETIGNEDIRWETTTQSNLGIDAGLLSNKLILALEFYHKYTSGILQQVPYPGSAGVSTPPYENIGEMQNNGFEFNANYKNSSKNRDFSYDFGIVLSAYRNEVKKLAANQFIAGSYTRTEVGMPISSFYGYVLDGIFQTQAEVDAHATQAQKAVGRWIYRDVNADGIVNDKDRTYIGNPHPDFEYSLNSRLTYKNFDLTLFIQGTYGNDIYFASKGGQIGTDFWADYTNKSTRILDTWSVNNRDAMLPEINILNPNDEANKVSTYLVEDGSYLRIKSLDLGYTLPSAILSKIGARQCRIFINAENLLTFTKYNNMDPEVKNSNDLSIGVDDISYMPLSRILSMGLSLSF